MKQMKMACMALLASSLLFSSCKNGDADTENGDSVTNSMEPNSSTPNMNPNMDSSYADTSTMMADTTTGMNSAGSMNGSTGAMANNRATNSTMRKSKKGKSTRYVVRIPQPNRSGTMSADKGGVYNYAEVMPSYRGGDGELESFIQNNLEYPQEALDNDVEGQVMVSFAVDENGKVYEPSVTSRRLGYGLEEAALNVVRKMPAWNPGRIKGQNVKTRFNLPITYQLY